MYMLNLLNCNVTFGNENVKDRKHTVIIIINAELTTVG